MEEQGERSSVMTRSQERREIQREEKKESGLNESALNACSAKWKGILYMGEGGRVFKRHLCHLIVPSLVFEVAPFIQA
jgi:hypothetical protein